jgi:hypothetical protein
VAYGVDQVAGGGKVPDGLGDECLAQRQAVLGRAAVADPALGREVLAWVACFADGDELAVLVIEFAEFILQNGEEPSLDGVPRIAQCRQSAHCRSPGLKASIA